MTDVLIPQHAYYQRKAIANIKPWLVANNTTRPGGRLTYQKDLGYTTGQSIYDVRLPEHWKKIRNLRGKIDQETSSPNELLQYRFDIGRTALKACEDTRRAYVHLKVATHNPEAKHDPQHFAEVKSWAGLEKYTREVLHNGRALPQPRLLDLPLDKAINSYWGSEVYRRPDLTYIGMVGLAAVILSQQTRGESEKYTFVWIEPGTPDNVYKQWDHA